MKWYYECKPAKITGTVEADNEEEANVATTQDALDQSAIAIFAGAWEMRRVEDE